ncbi:MAG: hypothetical protein MI976_01655 [Pseudomonadales bacterium]|nr:hypothetical protein [Pseudomonadales bacterium]
MCNQHALLTCCILALAACVGGGGGRGGDRSTDAETGVFFGPTEGLSFIYDDETSVTNSAGEFQYVAGEAVAFSIGDTVLGSVVLASGHGLRFITPVELVDGASDESNTQVTVITRLLMSLDDDGDVSNGITISESVGDNADEVVNLASLSASELAALESYFTELLSYSNSGYTELVSAETAQSFMNETLIDAMVGTYSGNFRGDDTGSFTIVVNGSGVISGSGVGSEESFSLTGMVTSDGSAAVGAASVGASFSGTIDRSQGTITGTWENEFFGETGSFSGTLQD